MKKLLSIGLALISFFTIVTPSVMASPIGGWDEDTGYWSSTNSGGVSTLATSSPESHTGWIEWGTGNKTKRVVGQTKWSNKYHYTRARWELYVTGTPEGDSGRVWGRNLTTAYSAYSTGDLVRAKTYYGH